ncbi:MAG: DUF1573 domain-containing protein [Bacteroidetes bacterium]|nr:DUF1573 domain-containing protein [Bacteroidota bacterium]
MNRFFVTLVVLLIAISGYSQPKIELREDKHNFGLIKEDGGKVNHVFAFKNVGNEALYIKTVRTPCGCTTPKWTKDSIPPGKGGYVEAVFDPMLRPGVFDKVLTIETNGNPAKYFITITGEVLPRKRTVVDNYPSKRGNLRFKLPQIYMGKVNSNANDTIHLGIYNESDKNITIREVLVPQHIKAERLNNGLVPARGFGKIIVHYDAVKRADLGFVTDKITLLTDDVVEPSKVMMVMADIELYFGALTPKQMEEAPKIKVEPMELDLGTVKMGETVSGKFAITNEGKTNLKIVRIIPECGCTSTKVPFEFLLPSETNFLEIEFKPEYEKGGQVSKKIDLFCSDPLNPNIELTIRAYVDDSNTDLKK